MKIVNCHCRTLLLSGALLPVADPTPTVATLSGIIYLRSSSSTDCRALKAAAVFMNLRRVHFSWCCRFSSSPSTTSSSVSWISPLQKFDAHEPYPPPETTTTRTEARRKSKYISHDAAINLFKREKDPHALEIFNMVSEQKGFNHSNATYATILNKLAQSKKFKAVDAVLYQMKYDACKYHEGIFLNLHFSKAQKLEGLRLN